MSELSTITSAAQAKAAALVADVKSEVSAVEAKAVSAWAKYGIPAAAFIVGAIVGHIL